MCTEEVHASDLWTRVLHAESFAYPCEATDAASSGFGVGFLSRYWVGPLGAVQDSALSRAAPLHALAMVLFSSLASESPKRHRWDAFSHPTSFWEDQRKFLSVSPPRTLQRYPR